MQGIFRKENTDKALKYGIYRHLPTYEKIIRNLVSFSYKKGKTVVKPVYDRVSMFCNGLAYVEKNGKAFYIDKTGKKAIVLP